MYSVADKLRTDTLNNTIKCILTESKAMETFRITLSDNSVRHLFDVIVLNI